MENKIEGNFIEYLAGDIKCRGYFVPSSETKVKRPAVIVIHAFQGQDDFARKKAEALHKLGYHAFACDLYGNGTHVESRDEAFALMRPLFIDRKVLQERIVAAFETVKSQPLVDGDKIGAIGFCFGGLTAYELVRSGVNVRGAVSFHGTLVDSLGDLKAKTVAAAKNISASMLILHGFNDPFMNQFDVDSLQKELQHINIDWQMHIYGNAMHAFTNPNINDHSAGLVYDDRANRRSWISMVNFFEEIFV